MDTSKYSAGVNNGATMALLAARDLRAAVAGKSCDLARVVNAAATQIELSARAVRDAHRESCGED